MFRKVLMVITLVALASMQSAFARDNFGAIAYSPSTGAYGYSINYGSKRVAQNRALDKCDEYARTSDCDVLVWFQNACGSLAEGPDGYGSGWGTDRSTAERYALESCSEYSRRCKVTETVCTE